MTLSDKDRNELIKYRIEQANDSIIEAQFLISRKLFRGALNRIYYGMFYSILALAIKYRFETSKHAQLIGWFNKNFIYTNKINNKYGEIIKKSFIARNESDYGTVFEYNESEILTKFKQMEAFITEITRFISSES